MVLSGSITVQKDFRINPKGLNSSLVFIFLVFHPTIATL